VARTFNGTTDEISLSPGACATLNGAITLAAVVNASAFPAGGTFASVWTPGEAVTNVAGYMLEINSEGYPVLGTQAENTAVASGKHIFIGKWHLIVLIKAAGAVKPIAYLYDFATETWSVQEAEGVLANPTGTATQLAIGNKEPTKKRYWAGAIAAVGVWGSVLADDHIRSLAHGPKSYLTAWSAQTPAGLWALNQAGVGEAVKDLTAGKADQTAITGTTVSGGEPVAYVGSPTGGMGMLL
jgi:hypothetical protein